MTSEAREENEKEEKQENTGGSAASSTANGCLPAHLPGNASTADVAASTVPMTENPAVSGRAGVVVHVTGNQFGCKTRGRTGQMLLVSVPVMSPAARALPGLISTDGDGKEVQEMFVVQAAPQAVESVRTIVVLFAVISVIFWKTLIKLAVTVAAIVLVVLLTAGAIMIFQYVHLAR